MAARNILAISATLVTGTALAQVGVVGRPDYPSYSPGSDVKNGYSAQDLLDAEVHGANDEKIGDVQDLIVGPNGELRRLVVAVNEGWFGTGGRRLAIDFDDLKPGPKGAEDVQYVTAPVSKRNVEQYGLFEDKQASVKGKAREWRATELIGDYVSLKDLDNYGSVTDLMFDRHGQLRAIAAAPDMRDSVLHFYTSYNDDGWEPGDEYYRIPYSNAELRELLPEKQEQARQSRAE